MNRTAKSPSGDYAGKKKVPLVENPQDYVHSSARYYLEGFHAGYEVTDYMKIF